MSFSVTLRLLNLLLLSLYKEIISANLLKFMIDEIELKMESLLRGAIESPDIKLLVRWNKIISSLMSKEIKNKNHVLLNRLYRVLVDLVENLLAAMDMEESEDSLMYLGPNIFEALIKVKSAIEDYETFLYNAEDEKKEIDLKLSENQIKALEKIKNLSI